MQSFGSGSAAVFAEAWAAHVIGEGIVHAEGCNFTEFLFNGMLANYQYMWRRSALLNAAHGYLSVIGEWEYIWPKYAIRPSVALLCLHSLGGMCLCIVNVFNLKPILFQLPVVLLQRCKLL